MPRLKRRIKPESQTEQDIIAGMIVSDPYCRDVLQLMRLDYFKISYGKMVVKWVQEYFEKYHDFEIMKKKYQKLLEEFS